MLNHIVCAGRLVRDPDLKTTQSGVSVCNFAIACDRDFADKATGERECDFIDVVTWRGTADFVSRNFSKGRMIVVSGRLQTRKWTDKDGNKRTACEIQADNVYFGDSKPNGAQTEKPDPSSPPAGDFSELTGADGDLPF